MADLKFCLVPTRNYKTLKIFISLICRVNDVQKSKIKLIVTDYAKKAPY